MNGKSFNKFGGKSLSHKVHEATAKLIGSGCENAVGIWISRSNTKQLHSKGQYGTAPRLKRIGIKTFPV